MNYLQSIETSEEAGWTVGDGRPGVSASRGIEASRPAARGPAWRPVYLRALLLADAVGGLVAGLVAMRERAAQTTASIPSRPFHLSYLVVTELITVLWLATLVLSRVYNVRVLGAGNDEYRRILDSMVRMLAVVATLAFFFHLGLSRSFVAIIVPLTVAWTLVAHWVARKLLHRRRRQGCCQQRTIVVGSQRHVSALVGHLRQFPHVGLKVIGACTGGSGEAVEVGDAAVPVVCAPAQLVDWLRRAEVDAVVVADATVLGPGELRKFAWKLEGSGVDLIVAPSVTGVAGPRIAVRPLEGLPLLHLEEARFDGVTRVVKGVVERTMAALLLVAALPVLAAAAIAVRLSGPGPIFYRHVRIGRAGVPFKMVKFRTMIDGAEDMKCELEADNEHGDDPLFKMRHDPRITKVGKVLRRLSIDELPQFAHVVTGRMALVGPRPPTPGEVKSYTDDAWRRLLVRPGITGLWQVSGRSSLPWMETLRLDLYYVDNWSLPLDVVIMIKTFNAVLRGRGAY